MLTKSNMKTHLQCYYRYMQYYAIHFVHLCARWTFSDRGYLGDLGGLVRFIEGIRNVIRIGVNRDRTTSIYGKMQCILFSWSKKSNPKWNETWIISSRFTFMKADLCFQRKVAASKARKIFVPAVLNLAQFGSTTWRIHHKTWLAALHRANEEEREWRWSCQGHDGI